MTWTSILADAPKCTGNWRDRSAHCFSPAHRVAIDTETRTAKAGTPLGGASPADLASVAKKFGRTVPADLVTLLARTNGGTLQGKQSVLQLFGSSSITDPAQYDPTEWIPGGVSIGTDNGGSMYVYGRDGVYLVDMSAPDTKHQVGATLLAVARRVVDGDDLHQR